MLTPRQVFVLIAIRANAQIAMSLVSSANVLQGNALIAPGQAWPVIFAPAGAE